MKSHPKADFWKEHVAAARQDPDSISAYAKRHSIAIKALYYWHSKFKKINSVPKSVVSALLATH
ncbi:transposase-like protein [Oxalobacteraceae bacterium GrIS 2.11]